MQKITTLVQGCSECGAQHESKFSRIKEPVKLNNIVWTHQATCPSNGQVIFMRFVHWKKPHRQIWQSVGIGYDRRRAK